MKIGSVEVIDVGVVPFLLHMQQGEPAQIVDDPVLADDFLEKLVHGAASPEESLSKTETDLTALAGQPVQTLSLAETEQALSELDAGSNAAALARLATDSTFVHRSDERFGRVCERIRQIFGTRHAEEANEAIQIARRLRDDARAEVLAAN